MSDLEHDPFIQMICFPWATVIDLLRRDRTGQARPYLAALEWAEPKTTLVRATVCQHIYAEDMLPYFKHLKITDLFWSHARKSEPEIEGIRVHPYPLYPVRCMEDKNVNAAPQIPLQERRYLYSFVGAYTPGLYLTPARQWIFELPKRQDAYIERRTEWHYEKTVYGEQIENIPKTEKDCQLLESRGQQYDTILKNSIFSLCPSGSGPNSIRLWESFGFGCIPVVLADDFRPAADAALWRKSVIVIEEKLDEIAKLPALLERFASDRERMKDMSSAGQELWARLVQTAFIPEAKKIMSDILRGGPVHGSSG